MIIRKANFDPYNDKEIAEIFRQIEGMAAADFDDENPTEEMITNRERVIDLFKRLVSIEEVAVNEYLKEIEVDPEQLDRDVDEILDALDHQDFTEYIKQQSAGAAAERKAYPDKPARDVPADNPADALEYFVWILDDQIEAVNRLDLDPTHLQYAMVQKVIEWYPGEIEETPVVEIKPEKAAKKDGKVSFNFPREHLQSLTMASEKVFNRRALEELAQVEFDITPRKIKKKDEYTTYLVTLDLSAPELKGTERLTPFDRSVFNAVVSILNENDHGYFTAKQVAIHLLYGDSRYKNNPSPQFVGAVTKSIEKQSLIRIKINWTDHARLNGIPFEEGEGITIINYMLPIKECEITINGQTTRGYKSIDTPPIYEYADAVNQIARYDTAILAVPGNLDQKKVIIRDFLLREIDHMKDNPTWKRTITVDRVVTIAGDDPGTITKYSRKRIIDTIKSMLDYWKNERNHIKGYKVNLKSRKIHSITIDPSPLKYNPAERIGKKSGVKPATIPSKTRNDTQ